HNGYIEVYLNLGLTGLVLLSMVIFSRYREIRRRLVDFGSQDHVGFDFAAFGMAYLITFVFYNLTEGVFRALNFLFIIFLMISIEYSNIKSQEASAPAERIGWRRSTARLREARRQTVRSSGAHPNAVTVSAPVVQGPSLRTANDRRQSESRWIR